MRIVRSGRLVHTVRHGHGHDASGQEDKYTITVMIDKIRSKLSRHKQEKMLFSNEKVNNENIDQTFLRQTLKSSPKCLLQ